MLILQLIRSEQSGSFWSEPNFFDNTHGLLGFVSLSSLTSLPKSLTRVLYSGSEEATEALIRKGNTMARIVGPSNS